MNTILKAICKLTAFSLEEVGQKVSTIFKKMDTDNNGSISYEEFKVAAVEDPTLTLFFNDQEPKKETKISDGKEGKKNAVTEKRSEGENSDRDRNDLRYEVANDGETYQFQA